MNKWITVLQKNDYIGAKQLIKAGENINDTTEAGESVLAYALKSRCDNDLLDLLIDNGADLLYQDQEGVQIFDFAITYNNTHTVELLLAKGKDVNDITRKSGFTPLMGAVCYGRKEIVELLLAAGADVHATERKGMSAYDFAKKMNKKSMMELMEAQK